MSKKPASTSKITASKPAAPAVKKTEPAKPKTDAAKPAAPVVKKTEPIKPKTDAPKHKETHAAAKVEHAPVEPVTQIKDIKIKQIDEAINRGSDTRKAFPNKWPLIIDTISTARTFLRHTGANYINCLDPEIMKSEYLRKLLIGSIRYGRQFVIDLEESDISMWDSIKLAFDNVEKDLLEKFMDRSILKDKNYMRLVKLDVDGDAYDEFQFIDTDPFQFIVLTSNKNLDKKFLSQFVLFNIIEN